MLYNERISDERNARRKERAPAGRRRKDFRRRYESATDTETRSVEVERGAKKKAERNAGNKCKIVEGFRVKKILFAASQGVPFIKTGGLADVVGSLPKSIDRQYYDVRVILPKYGCMMQEMKDKMQYVTHFYMDYNWKNVYVGVLEAEEDGVHYYFIDNEYYFSGEKPYSDDPRWEIERFAYFSKAL